MKTRYFLFVLAIFFAFSLSSFSLVHAIISGQTANPAEQRKELLLKQVKKKQYDYKEEIDRSIHILRELEANPETDIYDKLIGESSSGTQRYRNRLNAARRMLSRAETAYRKSIAAEIAVETMGMAEKQRQEFLKGKSVEAAKRYEKMKGVITRQLANRLQNTIGEEDTRKAYQSAESDLLKYRCQDEIISEARRRISNKSAHTRLNKLFGDITGTYVEKGPGTRIFNKGSKKERVDEEKAYNAERWMKNLERRHDLEEYRRLADAGRFLDPSSGKEITGTDRTAVSRNAKEVLVEYLRKNAADKSYLGILTGTQDSRHDLADSIQHEIESTPEYKALDFITPGKDPNMPEVFSALAHAARLEEQKVHKWRTDFVEGGKFSTGAYKAHQLSHYKPPSEAHGKTLKEKPGSDASGSLFDFNWTGKNSLTNVDRRIESFSRDTDAVVDCFNAAAKNPDPRMLSEKHHLLLQSYGYIRRNPDGTETYQIPKPGDQHRRLASLGNKLSLPGSHWLNAISGRNITKTVISTVVPELVAGRVAGIVEGVGAGEKLTAFSSAAANVLTGTGIDAATELYETGKVETDRLLIESALLGTAMHASSRVIGSMSPGKIEKLSLRGIAKNKVQKLAAEALGLTSDAAIQQYYQAHFAGSDVGYDTFLANLINGTIARTVAAAHNEIRESGLKPSEIKSIEDVPGHLRGRIQDLLECVRPQQQKEIFDRATRLSKKYGEAEETLGNLKEISAENICQAMDRGDLSWEQATMLYKKKIPEDVMNEVAGRRRRILENNIEEAKKRAVEDVMSEKKDRLVRLKKRLQEVKNENNGLGIESLNDAIAETHHWAEEELALIKQGAIAPGSRNPTSDIDLTCKSHYLMHQLKKLYAGKIDPTTAKAYDLNRYMDVFSPIDDTRELLKKNLNGIKVKLNDGTEMSHGDLVEANSLASAMMHMNPEERIIFEKNSISNAPKGDRARIQKEFKIAGSSLKQGKEEIISEIQRLAGEENYDPNDPDTYTRARDNLYGKRTEELREMERTLTRIRKEKEKIRKNDPNSPRLKTLDETEKNIVAGIQRKWGYANREGIEAYSDFMGIDAIVKNGQLGEFKKIRKKGGKEGEYEPTAIRDLINDERFTAENIGYTRKQAEGVYNDQINMSMEHVNRYYRGEESASDAVKALGKYAERALLALKLKGIDVTKPPYDKINKLSAKLVRDRRDPVALEEHLKELGKGDADEGLNSFISLMENSLPNLKGVCSSAKKSATATAVQDRHINLDKVTDREYARILSQLTLNKERQRELDRSRILHGDNKFINTLAKDIDNTDKELGSLQAEKKRYEKLAKDFDKEDWKKAETIDGEISSIDRQLSSLPGEYKYGRFVPRTSERKRKLMEKRKKLVEERENLKKQHEVSQHKYSLDKDPEYQRIKNRISFLKKEKERKTAQLSKEVQRIGREREKKLSEIKEKRKEAKKNKITGEKGAMNNTFTGAGETEGSPQKPEVSKSELTEKTVPAHFYLLEKTIYAKEGREIKLRGKVVSRKTGEPLQGIRVLFTAGPSDPKGENLLEMGTEGYLVAKTNQDGIAERVVKVRNKMGAQHIGFGPEDAWRYEISAVKGLVIISAAERFKFIDAPYSVQKGETLTIRGQVSNEKSESVPDRFAWLVLKPGEGVRGGINEDDLEIEGGRKYGNSADKNGFLSAVLKAGKNTGLYHIGFGSIEDYNKIESKTTVHIRGITDPEVYLYPGTVTVGAGSLEPVSLDLSAKFGNRPLSNLRVHPFLDVENPQSYGRFLPPEVRTNKEGYAKVKFYVGRKTHPKLTVGLDIENLPKLKKSRDSVIPYAFITIVPPKYKFFEKLPGEVKTGDEIVLKAKVTVYGTKNEPLPGADTFIFPAPGDVNLVSQESFSARTNISGIAKVRFKIGETPGLLHVGVGGSNDYGKIDEEGVIRIVEISKKKPDKIIPDAVAKIKAMIDEVKQAAAKHEAVFKTPDFMRCYYTQRAGIPTPLTDWSLLIYHTEDLLWDYDSYGKGRLWDFYYTGGCMRIAQELAHLLNVYGYTVIPVTHLDKARCTGFLHTEKMVAALNDIVKRLEAKSNGESDGSVNVEGLLSYAEGLMARWRDNKIRYHNALDAYLENVARYMKIEAYQMRLLMEEDFDKLDKKYKEIHRGDELWNQYEEEYNAIMAVYTPKRKALDKRADEIAAKLLGDGQYKKAVLACKEAVIVDDGSALDKANQPDKQGVRGLAHNVDMNAGGEAPRDKFYEFLDSCAASR